MKAIPEIHCKRSSDLYLPINDKIMQISEQWPSTAQSKYRYIENTWREELPQTAAICCRLRKFLPPSVFNVTVSSNAENASMHAFIQRELLSRDQIRLPFTAAVNRKAW